MKVTLGSKSLRKDTVLEPETGILFKVEEVIDNTSSSSEREHPNTKKIQKPEPQFLVIKISGN